MPQVLDQKSTRAGYAVRRHSHSDCIPGRFIRVAFMMRRITWSVLVRTDCVARPSRRRHLKITPTCVRSVDRCEPYVPAPILPVTAGQAGRTDLSIGQTTELSPG